MSSFGERFMQAFKGQLDRQLARLREMSDKELVAWIRELEEHKAVVDRELKVRRENSN